MTTIEHRKHVTTAIPISQMTLFMTRLALGRGEHGKSSQPQRRPWECVDSGAKVAPKARGYMLLPSQDKCI